MALSTTAQLDASFKKLQNRSIFSLNFAVNNEQAFSNVQIGSNLIFAEAINNNPTVNVGTNNYDNDGVVERLTFNVSPIIDTLKTTNQSYAWQLTLPTDYTANGALNGSFSSGDVLYETLGALQVVSPQFGNDYELTLIDGTGTPIPALSPINYLVDYVNGTIFIENPEAGDVNFDISTAAPTGATGYLYIGDYVIDALGNSTGSGTLTGATNGLSLFSSDTEVGLGGTLIEDTIIEGAGFNFELNNIDNLTLASEILTLSANTNIFLSGASIDLAFTDAGAVDRTITGFTAGIDATSTVNELVTAFDVYDFVTGETDSIVFPVTGATNGLTLVDSNVELGGSLTGDTSIDLDTNNLEFTNGTLIASGLTQLDLFNRSLIGFTTGIDATSTNQELVTAFDVFQAVSGASPAGNDREIQFNDNDEFGTSPSFVYERTGGVALPSQDFTISSNHNVVAYNEVEQIVYTIDSNNSNGEAYTAGTTTFERAPSLDFTSGGFVIPRDAAVDPVNGHLYVASTAIVVYTGGTGNYDLDFSNDITSAVDTFRAVYYDSVDDIIYGATDDGIEAFNSATFASIPANDMTATAALNEATALAVDISNDRAYIGNRPSAGSDNILVYELSTGNLITTITLPGGLNINDIVLNTGTNRLYVGNDMDTYVFNTEDNTEVVGERISTQISNDFIFADFENDRIFSDLSNTMTAFSIVKEELQTPNLQVNDEVEFRNLASPSGQYALVIGTDGFVESIPFSDISVPTVVTAVNGLSIDGDNVVLGGTLTGNTSIDLDTNNLEFTNGTLVASGITQLDLFNQSLTGFTTGIDATSTNQELVTAADVYDFVTGETASIGSNLTAANGLSIDGDNVVLGGTLTGATTIDGGGNQLTLTGLGDTIIDAGANSLTLESAGDQISLITTDNITISGSGGIELNSTQLIFDFIDVNAQDRTATGFTTGITSSSTHSELVTALDVYDFVTGETGTIGQAEDGSYLDGVFTDFTPDTPIGTAIDRFNELFAQLVPANAPVLDDLGSISSDGGVAKLSFGPTKQIVGYTDVNDATVGSVVGLNGTFVNIGDRRGVWDSGTLTITLADNVTADPSTPTAAYPANAFGDGDNGSIEVFFNNTSTPTTTVDLTTSTAAINQAFATTASIDLSASASSQFPNGNNFDTFRYRTGSIDIPVSAMRDGYNFVRVDRINNGTTVSNYIDWVYDSDANNINSNTTSLTDVSANATTQSLSGVDYRNDNSLTFRYSAVVTNAYTNVYSTAALTSPVTTNLANATSFDFVGTGLAISPSTGTVLPDLGTGTNAEQADVTVTYDVAIDANKLLGNDSVSANLRIPHPLDGQHTTATETQSGFLVYTLSETSDANTENFTGEGFRLIDDTYGTGGTVTYADINGIVQDWDSTESLVGADAGHNTGLLVFDEGLFYPSANLLTTNYGITNGNFTATDTFTNAPASQPNYSTAVGNRNYVRKFQSTNTGSLAELSFVINHDASISLDTTTLRDNSPTLTGNQIKVEVSIYRDPSKSAQVIGTYNAFLSATGTQDGVGLSGAISSSATQTTATMTLDTFRVGIIDYVVVKVITGDAFNRRINSIEITNID